MKPIEKWIEFAAPFTAAEAHADGLTDQDLRRLLQIRRIVRRRRGIYVGAIFARTADENPETSHALDVHCLNLALGAYKDLTAVDLSAALIHGMEFHKPPRREIVVATGRPGVHGLLRDGYFLRSIDLPAADVTVRHDVRLTTPVRTLVDVVTAGDFAQGVPPADSALRKGLLSVDKAFEHVDQRGYLPGLDVLRDVLNFADGRAESVLESASRVRMYLSRLPTPLLQVCLLLGIRVDFFWPQFWTVGEADGMSKYLLGGPTELRRSVSEERARQQALEDHNIEVFRWGWADLEQPDRFEADLNAAFQRGLARRHGR